MSETGQVDFEGIADRVLRELVELRQAAATHLRYMEGVEDGLRADRRTMTREVATNIVMQQRRNLRQAIEVTGKLTPSGHADYGVDLPGLSLSATQQNRGAGDTP